MFDPKASPALLNDNAFNARIAAEYVRYQMDRYPDDLECVIAAYNAGTCYRNKHGQIVKQSQRYLDRVQPRLEKYERQLNID